MNVEQVKKILIDNSYVKETDIKKAEAYAKSHNTDFLDYLFSEGILSKEILGQALAENFGVNYAHLRDQKIEEDIFKLIPEVMSEKKGLIAFKLDEKGLHLGMVDPNNLESLHFVEKKVGVKVISYFITQADLDSALLMYRSGLKNEFEKIVEKLKKKELKREDKDELMVNMIDLVLQYGYENKVSDIHIEPYEDKVVVRFRIDGVMHDVLDMPKEFLDHILTRVKIISKMRTDEHRAAQDGKFRYEADGGMVDVRVSVLPITQGENIVMRILSSKGRQYSLTDLGLSSYNLTKVKRHIKNPHGMILVTGPTGSGKTTSLYAVLKILNRREVNIATIEDPVEYDMEGISQIQVNTKTSLTFAKGLRSIVRQDPDIIMVGEIRDEETAGIAVNAALTGHLVLSTLHTNDAATTLPRLLDMNVEPFLVASTINMVIAQRLIRKICPHCKVSYKLSKDELKIMNKNESFVKACTVKGIEHLEKLRLYKGTGCKNCGMSGYKGRIGIFEILEMSDKIKDLILKSASSDEITAKAVEEGMETILEDGIEKIVSGMTTPEEVMRVTIG